MSDQAVILLAEDREDDIILIRRSFKAALMTNPFYVVRNGEEAIAYLKGEGQFANREEYPLPDLLLLDLKMPRMDGFDVLEWLKATPSLASLRVIVLTSSENLHDVNRAYQLGANSFLVKPLEFHNFIAVSKTLGKYWLGLDRPPEISRDQKLEGAQKLQPLDPSAGD
jgi:CheY-like chemotaxis protein